jgi:hypothetical protein
MSNINNENILETYYEEGLAEGMTDEQAEAYAYEMLEVKGNCYENV